MERKTMERFSLMKWAAMLLITLAVTFSFAGLVSRADNINYYRVNVKDGYLALRSAKAFDSANEIGRLYTGEIVNVIETNDSTYWYVESTKLQKKGYVNKNYLEKAKSLDTLYEVTGVNDYLALRTAKAYKQENEIGKMYNGDTIEVYDTTDPTYWYVYCWELDRFGFTNKNYLVAQTPDPTPTKETRTVKVSSGYLALRSAKATDPSNEIGRLYTGETVEILDKSDSTFWYVYSSKLDKRGYVNCNYLVGNTPAPDPTPTGETRTVKVDSGYLALRSAKATDPSNEIGCLYTGETVEVLDKSDSTFWYVYSSKLGKKGYVNCNYLVGYTPSPVPSGQTRTVSVNGYLALRNAQAFDASNEIGKLYTGDTVTLVDVGASRYVYVYAPRLGQYGYVDCNYIY